MRISPKIKKNILKIISAIIGIGIADYVFSFPFRVFENWAMGYLAEKVQESWRSMLSFVIIWIIPLIILVGIFFLGYLIKDKIHKSNIPSTKTFTSSTEKSPIEDSTNLINALTQMHRRLIDLQQVKYSKTKVGVKQFEKANSILSNALGLVELEDRRNFEEKIRKRILQTNTVKQPRFRRFLNHQNNLEWAIYRRGLEDAALKVAAQVKDEQIRSRNWTLEEDCKKINDWMDGLHWGIKDIRDSDPQWGKLDESLSNYLTDVKLGELILKHIEFSRLYNNTCLMAKYSERFYNSMFSRVLHALLVGSPISPANVEIALGEILREIKTRLIEIGDSNQLGIEIIETRIEPFGSIKTDTIFVDAIFRTQKRVQISKINLEYSEGQLLGFISANVNLPHYLDGNENHTLEFPIKNPPNNFYAALWYISEQTKIARGESRSKGRLIVVADGHEWMSNFFDIPTRIDAPIVRLVNPGVNDSQI